MRKLAIFGLGLALMAVSVIAGCASIDKYLSVVTQANLDVTRNTYDTLLAGAATYNELPRCAAGVSATLASPCSTYVNVVKLREVDKSVLAALDQAQADINACDPGASGITTTATGTCSTLTTDYNTLKSLITVAQTSYTQITGKSL